MIIPGMVFLLDDRGARLFFQGFGACEVNS